MSNVYRESNNFINTTKNKKKVAKNKNDLAVEKLYNKKHSKSKK